MSKPSARLPQVAAVCLGLFLGTAEVSSQQAPDGDVASLEMLKERFRQHRELLAEPIAKLNVLYERQLTALRDKVKDQGDLDKVLAVDEELRGFRNEDYRPEESFPEIERLREIYRTELAKRQSDSAEGMPPFLRTYLEQLEELSRELTRQDRVGEALAAREEAENASKLLAELDGGGAPATVGKPSAGPDGGGRMGGLGFGKRPDALGNSPRGVVDVVSIKYWERSTFDAGWVALRANGSLMTDLERRVSSSRDRIVAYDCGAAGIVMVRDDGSVDAGLCKIAPPEELRTQLVGIVGIALGRLEEQFLQNEAVVAVRDDGTLVWWGPGAAGAGVAGPPQEARSGVAKIVSGRGVFTAIKKDGSLVTWRFAAGDGRIDLPEEVKRRRFRQIAMSEGHSVGLATNGRVYAWGENSSGQCDVPAGLGDCTEVAVIHNAASLARKADGIWVSWGRDYGGIRDALGGSTGRRNIVGRLFPPGGYAYAVWIEE